MQLNISYLNMHFKGVVYQKSANVDVSFQNLHEIHYMPFHTEDISPHRLLHQLKNYLDAESYLIFYVT